MYLNLIVALIGCDDAATTEAPQPAPEATPAPEPVVEEAPAEAAHHWNLNSDGVVLHGFDAVSYRGEAPEKGSSDHALEWDGATWHFSSAENLATFQASPEAYAPALGGFCTFGVVIEKKLDGDPNVYWMNDETLYLFLNEEVRGKFAQDESGNLNKISENWPALRNADPQG